MQITPEILCVAVGFLLGFATGRLQVPATIIIAIFATKRNESNRVSDRVIFFTSDIMSSLDMCAQQCLCGGKCSLQKYALQ